LWAGKVFKRKITKTKTKIEVIPIDYLQTVDDIYQAAEHLILPPARRDANLSEQTTSSSTVQYDTGPLIHRQGSFAEHVEEIPIVEDFWGAVPDY
jgi:hypothetical protein